MLGERIREKRQELKLTIRELAEGAGLTPGFLSQVERNLTEPSITSLRKISLILGVPIFYFLMEHQPAGMIVRKGERKVVSVGGSGVVFELLSPDFDRTIEMIIGRVEPGAVTCEEPLAHYGEENLLVTQGEMKIQVGEETFVLEEGDSILYRSSLPHKIWNLGENELVFVSAISPPAF
ncbi:MAG TPA: cupin domain-containing protein [Negativicutes bacterium]|nr:cupin domain-containing protein [Negativicutes bacterium]